jgi:uncharacterized protein YciI
MPMLFVAYCLDKPRDGAEIRRRARADHLKFVLERERQFLYGGPLLSETGATIGSLMIFEVEDRASLDRLLATEPYCNAGLFETVMIHATRQIVPELSPGLLRQEFEKELAGLQKA